MSRAGLVLVAFAAASCAPAAPPAPRPNIVLVTIDTLRADHLGSYGYARPTSPSIDRLAETGLLFERALSAAPWTLPSMATLHTSLHPPEHGAIGARTRLPDGVTTIAESLQGAGYDTLAFVTHSFVGRRYGLAQGFRVFDDSLALGHQAVTSHDLTGNVLRTLGLEARDPFFLWVHYFDPHFSYVRHPEFGFLPAGAPERLGWDELQAAEPALRDEAVPDPFSVGTVEAIYDEEIAFTDEAVGRLLEGLEGLALDRPTVVVLTADHGEYFMERGRFGHGRDVYDELLHVPLVVSGDIDAGLRGRRLPGAVGLASVAHTLAALARVERNPFRGEDLLAPDRREGRPVFAFGCYAGGAGERKVLVESRGWKLIRHLDGGRFELYDLRRDPRESEDRWGDETEAAASAKAALRAALEEFPQLRDGGVPSVHLAPEEIEGLEALGYAR